MEYKNFLECDMDSVCEFILDNHRNNQQVVSMYTFSRMVSERLRGNIETGIACIADGKVVGVITAITANKQNYWAIGVLYVDEEYRNKGIAKSLVEELEKSIAENCHSNFKVNISVNKSNEPIAKVFDYKDYLVEGCIKGLVSEDDMVIMGKIRQVV
ncbi:GNAT family N-acetyltransferase [Butyrivibrio fibrisolvens]|uniref:GNAT family N-acetyltransferase n=1 Tax=Pseudobutyrivibrio ruminis TaxID=46206 RepID=UPI0003FC1916|nr:GNAT family N-acetyltransferase [Pseudobutyrivibrio ruminis]MDC7279318.1 GNAT family N-acetyltransferase [Butyrivibrio fibrisolvens]